MVDKKRNIVHSHGSVTYQDRCQVLQQKGLVIWFTGLSGSGKSTIAIALEKRLNMEGFKGYRLDGDNVRFGLNSDLGFSKEDRDENIRRISEVAALFKDAGLITLVSFISPFKKMRQFAREKAGEGQFIEVYVKANLETCKSRDPKGLYKKVEKNEITEFTGVTSPYEAPDTAELVLDTDGLSIEEAVQKVYQFIEPLVTL